MLNEIKVSLSVPFSEQMYVYFRLPKGHGYAVFPSTCDYTVFPSTRYYAVFPSICNYAASPVM